MKMNTELHTQDNITIKDRLMFFCSDKPAAQFVRGTQIGGHYPCGSCGADVRCMDDFAHCSGCKWRSLQDLPTLAVKGNYV
jgi:hypothetical protein